MATKKQLQQSLKTAKMVLKELVIEEQIAANKFMNIELRAKKLNSKWSKITLRRIDAQRVVKDAESKLGHKENS
jgi:hypothetical protein